MLIRVPLDRVTQILRHQMNFSSPVGSFNLHAALPALEEPLFFSPFAAEPTQRHVSRCQGGRGGTFCLFLTGVE